MNESQFMKRKDAALREHMLQDEIKMQKLSSQDRFRRGRSINAGLWGENLIEINIRADHETLYCTLSFEAAKKIADSIYVLVGEDNPPSE